MILHTTEHVLPLLAQLRGSPTVLLYIGPDQLMPLTSALGAVVGIVLMFWNRLVGLLHKLPLILTRRTQTADKRPTA